MEASCDYRLFYQCSGSFDPEIVRSGLDRLLPNFQHVDLDDADRLADALSYITQPKTAPKYAEILQKHWLDVGSKRHMPRGLAETYPVNASLPLVLMKEQDYWPILRLVESLALEDAIPTVFVYWSRFTAAKLLPTGNKFRDLMKYALAVCIFSEDHPDPPDEWVLIAFSNHLCCIVYGQEELDRERFSEEEKTFTTLLLGPPDAQGTDEARVPRVPHPNRGDTGIQLPEPD